MHAGTGFRSTRAPSCRTARWLSHTHGGVGGGGSVVVAVVVVDDDGSLLFRWCCMLLRLERTEDVV